MNKYLVITIDVEPDCTFNWKYSDPLTFNGVHEGIAKRLQPLFIKYGFVPTYLINNVVLEDSDSVQTLKNLDGHFELGTHLHPEFLEPQKTEYKYAGKKGIANSCFYDPEIEFQKIRNITHLFAEKFDLQPLSFRAGRFSAGTNTWKSLTDLGYKVDTSVTPNIRWDDHTRERPVDFRWAPLQPYWITDEKTEKSLLQVPVSIIREKLSFPGYVKSIVSNKRLPFKGSKPLWLRPKFSGPMQFKKIVEDITILHEDEKNVVFNMMFHNVEVMPGLSPYSITEDDCTSYLQSIEWFLNYCSQNNIGGTSLSSLYDLYKK